MTPLDQFRQQNPQYGSVDNVSLAAALHRKFYPDVPMTEFTRMIGLDEAERKTYDPTAGMSGAEISRAGLGRSFVELGRGVKQFVAGIVDPAGVDARRSEIAEDRSRDAPLMRHAAAKVGNLAGAVATALPATLIPGANTVAGSALIGAGYGLLQPSTSGAETLTNVALGGAGGAAGQKVGQAIGKSLRTPSTTLTEAQREALKAARALGFGVTPGEQAGSKTLQQVEAALESNPITSGPLLSLREANQKRLNEIAAKAVGEKADELSAPVLDRAFARIGKVYERVASQDAVPLDRTGLTTKLIGVLDDYKGQYNGNNDAGTNALFKQFVGFIDSGSADRAQLARLSSNLGRAVKNNMTSANGDRALGLALADVKEIVDDALEAALPAKLSQEFSTARQQYRTLMQLTTRQNVVNPSTGNVSGKALANYLQAKDRTGFLRGRNTSELYDAARFAQAFPRIVGDSGTATRSMGAMDYLASIPGGLLTRLYMSGPMRGITSVGTPAVNAMQNAAGGLLDYSGRPVGIATGGLLGAYVAE